MTDRAIFNRIYTSFQPGSTPVWLVNGAGVTTSPSSTVDFIAGVNLIQGAVVYVSGTYVLPASAASGVSPTRYNPIGITTAAASAAATVPVNLDYTAVVSAANITAESTLVPGEYYYLSKFDGQLTRFTTASGDITASGGYAAVVSVGQAVSTSELQIEIDAPIIIYS
jgi:hypothetical protein